MSADDYEAIGFKFFEQAVADKEALDKINYILSSEEWSVSFLEDICEVVRSTGRQEIEDAYWEAH